MKNLSNQKKDIITLFCVICKEILNSDTMLMDVTRSFLQVVEDVKYSTVDEMLQSFHALAIEKKESGKSDVLDDTDSKLTCRKDSISHLELTQEKENKPTSTKDRNSKDSSALLKYQELMRLYESRGFIREFKEALDNPFEVMIMATMSSGKSTLINAMLGIELLPTANQACTATICRIKDNDSMKKFKCRAFKEGKSTIWKPATPRLLREWNVSDEFDLVDVEGNMPFIRNTGAKLVIYDTPGPNFSNDKTHAEILSDAISSHRFGAIVFLLNASHLGTYDERQMLNNILEIRKSNKKFNKRTIFVVSKVDRYDEERGENLKKEVRKVKTYLRDLGFKSPKVIPIMGRAALLARKLANNKKLTKREQLDLIRYIEQIEASPRYLFDATTLYNRHIKAKIDEGIAGSGHHITKNKNDVKRFNINEDFSITWKRLNTFLYSTGLPTLELYLENLIIREALPKTMRNVARVLKKHGAVGLQNWIKSE